MVTFARGYGVQSVLSLAGTRRLVVFHWFTLQMEYTFQSRYLFLFLVHCRFQFKESWNGTERNGKRRVMA